MPIDPSIPLGVKTLQLTNPLERYMQMQQIDQAQNQSRLADLMYGEKQQQISRAQNLRTLANGWNADTTDEQRRDSLRNNGYFDEADRMDTTLQNRAKVKADAGKADAEAQAKHIETLTKVNGLLGSAAGAVVQNPNYDSAVQLVGGLRQQLGPDLSKQLGLDTLEIPRDPAQLKAWAQDHYRASIDTEKQLADARAAFEGNANRKSQQQIAAGHDATSRANNRDTIAATKEAARQGQYDAERGVIVDKVTGVARPVVGADGKPISTGTPKLTEDQAKATGWLSQAENAWKNMQTAMGGVDAKGKFKNQSVASPGFNDALAEVPSLGVASGLANTMRSANRQKFMQASSSLSEALLRAATGAGVTEAEAAQKIRELTPVFGDGDDVIKQKMDSIPVYLNSLKVRAGPGAKAVTPTAPAVPDDIQALLQKHGGK